MIPILTPGTEFPASIFETGVLIPVDKPEDWTSFDVVAKIRNSVKRVLGVKKIKVGHSGTLDPFATGLLLICTGKATKQLAELTGMDKSYEGRIRLGGRTETYDNTSEVVDECKTGHLTLQEIRRAAEGFTGWIDQEVPAFSAVKQDGKRLYKKARAGELVELPVRKVLVKQFEILDWDGKEVTFHVDCGKGTYIRSLANDLGRALQCGGYLNSLRRTAIGEYTIEQAWPLKALIRHLEQLIGNAADHRDLE